MRLKKPFPGTAKRIGQKVREVWDVLDASGRKTGRTMFRGDPIAPGDYHLVVHIWILNERMQYLIQKRADYLKLSDAFFDYGYIDDLLP